MKAVSTGFTILVVVIGFSFRMYRVGRMIDGDSGQSSGAGKNSGAWVVGGTADQSGREERREKKKRRKSVQKNPYLD